MIMSKTETSLVEFRCDKCNEYLAFDKAIINEHYENKHKSTAPDINLDALKDMRLEAHRFADGQSVSPIQASEIENDADLSFMSAEKIHQARMWAYMLSARLYKFKTLASGWAHKKLILSSGAIIDFDIFISESERMKAARSMINKDINFNHYLFMPGFNFVIDAEDVNGALVGLMIIEDPVINELYDRQLVTGVSVEYFTRKQACNCETKCVCTHEGVYYVGMAIITVPLSPADKDSQVQQMLASNFAVEITGEMPKRLVSDIQDAFKANYNNLRDDYSYQGQSEQAGNNKSIPSTTSGNDPAIAAIVSPSANDSAQQVTQPDNKNSEYTMTPEETTKLINDAVNAAVVKLTTETQAKIAELSTANAELVKANEALKADVLEMRSQSEKLTASLATGKGEQTTGPSADELAKVVMARVNMSSLAEVVQATEQSKTN